MKKKFLRYFSPLIIFFCFTVFITYPLIFNFDKVITGFGDELLIVWIHNWVIHSLLTNPFSLFDANIYYPFINSLAYSDIFLTSSILAFIPVLITKEPVTAINFTLFISLVFLGYSLYLLVYYLTKDYFVSLLSGTLVIFSPAVLIYYVHLQVLAVWWVPLAILTFIHFHKSQQSRYLAMSLGCFLLQTYNSFLPGFFILFSYFIIIFIKWIYERKKLMKLVTKKNIFLFLSTFILLLPIIIPYYQVSKEYNYRRDIREAVHLSIQPEDFLFSSNFSRLREFFNGLPFNKISQNNEFQSAYPGLVFTFLIILTIIFYFKYFKKKDVLSRSFFFISLTGIVLSLGPVLHLGRKTIHDPFLIPLPYALFYYIIPGFQGFRNAARWEMLFIIAIAVLIALTLNKILKKVSNKKKLFLYLILFVGIIVEYNFPMQFLKTPQRKEFPEVYSWLATTPQDTKVIEMPIYVWNMHPYVFDENMREYYATVHFRKMINGASGYSPEPWQVMARELVKEFPSEASLNRLRELQINYVIIHKKEYDRLAKDNYTFDATKASDGETIIKLLSKKYKLKLIKKFNEDYVYAL
jgi:hypothetical protein